MVKIIKEGKIKSQESKEKLNINAVIECVMCGCVFEFSKDEIKYPAFLEGNSSSGYVICPCCGDEISDY